MTVNDSSKTEQTAGTGKIIGGWPVNVVGGTLIFNEGIVEAQDMGGWFADGSTVTINGGTFTSADNAVLGTPGNAGRGGNTITINGGTFNGNITTSGYIACGIYAANNDTWNIAGGAFNITGGAGIVVRAGKVNLTGGAITTSGSTTGKVGDAGNAVPCSAIVLDVKAGYPGAAGTDQITIGNATLTTADGVDAIAVLEGDGHSYVDGSITAAGNTLTVPADYKWVAEGNGYDLVKIVVDAQLVGANLLLKGATIMQFHFKFPESSRAHAVSMNLDGRVVTTLIGNGGTSTVEGAKVFAFPVYAKQLKTKILVTVLDENGETLSFSYQTSTGTVNTNAFEYAVTDYLNTRTVTQGTATLQALGTRMKEYANYAKYYFDNRNASTSYEGTAAPMPAKADLMQYAASIEGSGNTLTGARLNLEEVTSIRLYFSDWSQTFEYRAPGGEWQSMTPIVVEGAMCVEIRNINVQDLDTMWEIRAINGNETYTVHYSALSYVLTSLYGRQSTASQSLKDMLAKLYYYNKAADDYFHN